MPTRIESAGPNRRTTSRHFRIFTVIQRGDYPASPQICKEVCCSRASFYRDLEYMKVDLGLPIEWDATRNGYYLTEPVASFPSMQITTGELVSMLLARRALERTRNAAFAPQIGSAMDKLGLAMSGEIRSLWEDLDSVVSFRASAVEVLTDVDVCVKVFDALQAREELELLYWKLDAPAPTPKRLQPLHLLCVDSAWYLFAVDPATPGAAPRTYLLSRMSELHRTGKRFRRPEHFHPDDLLAHSIGIYGGEAPHRLHLRLGPRAARWFGERRFHASQQFTPHPDGTAELTMEVAVNPELERLILSWGSQVEVLAPAALRESIWRTASEVIERGTFA